MAGMPRIPDARPSSDVYSVYDIVPPVTSYAAALTRTPLISQNQIPPSSARSGSAVVNRRPRRSGYRYFYSHGGVQQPRVGVPRPGAGGVQSSAFQTTLVQLHDWSINADWFEAGYPRNLGYVTRVPQPITKVTGAPGNSQMDPKPIFPRVQVVPRYYVMPPRYQTRSQNG